MIQGNKREVKLTGEFGKKVGYFLAEVVAVNPDAEWFAQNNMELKEDSKSTDYLLTNNEGNPTMRVSFWLKEKESGQLFNVNYFLEDKVRMKLDGTKTQFINNQGVATWSDKEENLPEWFKKHDYRQAKVGEEELYSFMRAWLDGLDYREASTVLCLDWKKLMNGDVREIKQQVKGEYSGEVVMMATVKTKDTPEGIKEYQNIFNKVVIPGYNMKYLKTKEFTDESLEILRKKKPKELKTYEKFVVAITDSQYGCKNFYSLRPLHDYDPNENPVGKREPVAPDNADY